MIIGSKISYNIWDGGSGASDRHVLIGYCKEPPIEVLEKLIKTHCIHSYRTLFCSPIDEYPANCEGLIINSVCQEMMRGISIAGELDDLMTDKNMKNAEWNHFSLEKFQASIQKKHEYAEQFEDSNSNKKFYREIVEDWKTVINKIEC